MAELTLTKENFAREVEQFDGVVLVDFWAPWCGPCRMVGPTVERVAESYAENANVKVGKLDIDQDPEIADKYGIRSIPALKVFSHGSVKSQLVGVQPEPAIKQMVEAELQSLTSTPQTAA